MYGLNEAVWSVKLATLFDGIEESLKMVPGAAGGADEALYGGAAGPAGGGEDEKNGEDDGPGEEGEGEGDGAWACAACRARACFFF
jgi:hypothetical protein